MGELVQYQNPFYQWVKGDNTGRVEEIAGNADENGLNFIVFKSGRRINESLLLEYLMEVPEYAAKVAEESAIINGRSQATMQQEQYIQTPSVKAAQQEGPVMQLLKAQKSVDEISLKISFDVKVPKKEMISVLKVSFGDEIETDIQSYISDQLDKNSIEETLTQEIKKFIKKYYESKP
jgi:hypothetical protein